MRRPHRALATLALGLALATATTAAWATPPTATQDQTDPRKALYQSELERNLQLRAQAGNEVAAEHGLAAQRKALYQSELEQTLARHRALGAIAQPAARTDPAAQNPGVEVLASLLLGLVGGLIGGAAAMLGWTATTRRRRPPAAAGT